MIAPGTQCNVMCNPDAVVANPGSASFSYVCDANGNLVSSPSLVCKKSMSP